MTTLKNLNFSNQLDQNNYLLNGRGNPEKTSNKYHGASSQDMIDAFTEVGYQVRAISQPLARDRSNLAFNKHIIRLASNESMELFKKREVGLDFPEIVIVNNNNNRGSLQVMLGVFRLVCANGMILGDHFFSSKVRHDSNFQTNLFNTLINASEQYPRVNEIVAQMKSIHLTKDQGIEFRERLKNAYAENFLVDKYTLGVQIHSNFNPTRIEDLNLDLWTTFNRFQEYFLRHGISYTKTSNVPLKNDPNTFETKIVNQTTREVKGSDKTVKLNQLLMNETLEHFNIAA